MASVAGIVRQALREFIDHVVANNEGIGERYRALKRAKSVGHLKVIK
jgi:hypothetical protein